MKTLSFNYSELGLILSALKHYRVELYHSSHFDSGYADFLNSVIRKFEDTINKYILLL